MARLPLIGGSYLAKSVIANAQRCINLFPEKNQPDALVPLTYYQRPGFRALASGPEAAPVRQVYRASNGVGYCVIGQKVYLISQTWELTELGTLLTPATTPVSFSDNGITIWLVDGSSTGYQIDLTTNVFSATVDPSGIFTGADRVDYIDTFMLWNVPGTKNFGSTLSNTISFDPTYIAAKTNFPDPLVTLIVNRHEILLLGQSKTEIWYDAGNPDFPFAELPGAYTEHGCCAKYSIASQDIAVYWLGQDLQGQGIVFRQRGYECKRISNHALEFAIQKYGTISDAIGYTYQQNGHVFYVLSFPSADATWAFDEATEEWSQRAWTDGDGVLHRDRSNCAAFIYGTNVVGDWENGTLYALDPNVYTDEVLGTAGPISFVRSFPHIGIGIGQDSRPVTADGRTLEFSLFTADIECGNVAPGINGKAGEIFLRWSDDRGHTFGQAVPQPLGAPGQYISQPRWPTLGMARDRIFELSWSSPGQVGLNGAWVEAKVMDN